MLVLFFFQAEDGIRDLIVTGVQTCALPISRSARTGPNEPHRGVTATHTERRDPSDRSAVSAASVPAAERHNEGARPRSGGWVSLPGAQRRSHRTECSAGAVA